LKVDFDILFYISARVSLALLITSSLLLFFPLEWLPFDFSEARTQYGIYLFLVFVFSASTIFSYIIKWVMESCKKLLANQAQKCAVNKMHADLLKKLSDDEKQFLSPLYEKRQNSIMISLNNPIHKRLQTAGIISQAKGTSYGSCGTFPGQVNLWVYEVLDKHPKYLTIKQK